jgi:hypothetical protein
LVSTKLKILQKGIGMRTLTFGILCKSYLHGRFAICLLSAVDQLREYKIETQIYVGRSNLPAARSELVSTWWKTHRPGDLFFFLDADHTFTVEDIRSILALDADLRCGIYANSEGTSTAVLVNPDGFYKGTDSRLLLAGCGLMAMTWEIVDRVIAVLPQVSTDDPDKPLYPLFQPLLLDQQTSPQKIWLSEDKSFCYRVREVGGVIRGVSRPTIGHEVYKLETL